MPACGNCSAMFPTRAGLGLHLETTGHGFPCPHCTKRCVTEEGVSFHRKAVHNLPCPQCLQIFNDRTVLREHKRVAGHCFCRLCERLFASTDALAQHTQDFVHKFNLKFFCGDCNRGFGARRGLRRHQRASGHCFCESCKKFFASPEDSAQHQKDSHGITTDFHCCMCDQDFANGEALRQHLVNDIHALPPTVPNPLECVECQKIFKTERGLADHLASLKHNPLSNIPSCPASKKCRKSFSSPSALAQHLESGTCRSGINRKKLNAVIQATDTQGIIIASSPPPSLLLDNTESSTSSPTGSFVVFTPDTDSIAGVPLSPGQFTPSSHSSDLLLAVIPRNPLSCPLCPPARRPFRTATDLEHHLASPAHDTKIYSCPTSLFTGVEGDPVIKRFATLSGLTQHLESGACAGGNETLRRAVRMVEEKMRALGVSWEGVRLLL